MNYKQEFIEFLVRANVLTFGDFITKSGRKVPYFINTGNFKTAEQITKLGQFYASCIEERAGNSFDVLFGPAYKGIPLAVSVSIALYQQYQRDVKFCFNRKEKKDHGEGGNMVGYVPQHGDRVVIVEDVITAGTAVRESIPLLKSVADVEITDLIISVDRMERGQGERSATKEIYEEFGIRTHAIVTIKEIIAYLHNREVDGRIVIDDEMKGRIEGHLAVYGGK